MAVSAYPQAALVVAALLCGLVPVHGRACFYKLGTSWAVTSVGVDIIPSDNSIIVANARFGAESIQRYSKQGALIWSTPPSLSPYHVGVDSAAGRIYVGGGSVIQIFDIAGQFFGKFSTPGAVNVAVAADGTLFATTRNSGQVRQYHPNGTLLQQTGGFTLTWGVAVSPTTGDVFVTDALSCSCPASCLPVMLLGSCCPAPESAASLPAPPGPSHSTGATVHTARAAATAVLDTLLSALIHQHVTAL
ncbi:hypothetical protein ABPG75_010493 [Micractinium tetrahymenae]